MSKPIIVFYNVQATYQAFDKLPTPAMVSIGCTSVAGHEFYAELTDTFAREACSVYVQQRVLPLLEGKSGKDECLMTEAQTAQELKTWVESLGLDQQVMFHSSHPKMDWHFVEELLDKYGWPANLYRVGQRIAHGRTYYEVWSSEALSSFRLTDMRDDHALVIARRLRHAHNVITEKYRAKLLDVCTRYSGGKLPEADAMQAIGWKDRRYLIEACGWFELPEPVPTPAPITSDIESFGGMPVFTGTRVPVTAVFENLAGGLNLDDILTCFPALKREQTMNALRIAGKLLEQRYAHLHRY